MLLLSIRQLEVCQVVTLDSDLESSYSETPEIQEGNVIREACYREASGDLRCTLQRGCK